MRMHICRYCYEELKSRGEKVKMVDKIHGRYAVDEERECDLCEEVDNLMEVEAR